MKIKSCYPIIVVDDIDATKAFYCDTLGFAVKHEVTRLDGGKVLVLANDLGVEIEVLQSTTEGPVKLSKGPYGFRVNVDDIEEAEKEIRSKGTYEVSPIFDTKISRNLSVVDNSGVHITVMEHKKN